jgi:hypothetical protein
MTGLCQSAGRDYADRFVASDATDTNEGAPTLLPGPDPDRWLVEGVI